MRQRMPERTPVALTGVRIERVLAATVEVTEAAPADRWFPELNTVNRPFVAPVNFVQEFPAERTTASVMPTRAAGQVSGIRSLFAIGWFTALPLGCQATPQTAALAAETQVDVELETIRDTVTRVTHEIDGKRWPELRRLYADEVRTDYTSLFGGAPAKQTGDALIES
jgi:hypothetical protein